MKLGGGHSSDLLQQHPPGRVLGRGARQSRRTSFAVRDRVAPGEKFGIGLRLSARAAARLASRDARRVPGLPRCERALRLHHQWLSLRHFPRHAGEGGGLSSGLARRGAAALHRLLADLLAELAAATSASKAASARCPAHSSRRCACRGCRADCRSHVATRGPSGRLRKRSGRSSRWPSSRSRIAFSKPSTRASLSSSAPASARGGAAACWSSPALAAPRPAALHEHIGLCLDLCHAAVEFEDPAGCIRDLARCRHSRATRCRSAPACDCRNSTRSGHGVAAVRRSCLPASGGRSAGRRHHPLCRSARSARYARRAADGREWRVHCHVPIFLDDLAHSPRRTHSSAKCSRSIACTDLRASRSRDLHLECAARAFARRLGMDQAIARELTWVQGELSA